MLEELKTDIISVDDENGFSREELFPLIIEALQEENMLVFSTSSRSLLNITSLIEAFSQIDIPFWKVCGYGSAPPFSNAIARCAKNMNKPKEIHWDSYLLSLLDYKYCKTCDTIKSKDSFSKQTRSSYNISHICKSCEAERHIIDKKDVISTILDTMKNIGRLPECSCCGYKENFAALDFHHIDNTIERPEWAIGRTPSTYILGCSPQEAKRRYLAECDNLELLCHNCHTKEHNSKENSGRSKVGLLGALRILDREYKCEECNESTNLHLHHNNPDEKEYSFHDFGHQSKEKIIKDNSLKKELEKDVSILCGNHHAEIHSKNYLLQK